MAMLLKTIAALGVAAFVVAASPAHSAETASPNDTARFIAGLPPAQSSQLAPLTQDPAWQQHAQLMNAVWAGLEQYQLSKVRAWSRANVTARRPVTYYFFSGPDFLYADAFLPNSSTYILAGLELIGPQPDALALRPRFLARNLESVRRSISTLLSRSYFITSYMGSDLNSGQLRGTLPILYVFLARTGKTIHEVSFVTIKQDGTVEPSADGKDGTRGVKIVFSGPDNKQQTLYYFRTDLSNKGVQSSGFLEFCRQFGIGDVFIKAASYLLHTPGFSVVRDFLLNIGATVVQDDTGVPHRYFEERGWQVLPFGRYVGPIRVFRGYHQAKLKTLFEKADAPPIDFGIGYRWRTNELHVLLAINPNPQTPPGPQAASSEKSPQDQPPASGKATPSAPATPPVVRADKTAPDNSAPPNPPPANRENAAKQKSNGTGPSKAARPAPVASEASRFTSWPSLLFGGLFSAALVALFGLEGIAAGLGFLLQAAIIGLIAWLAVGFFRAREEQAAATSAPAAGRERAAGWQLTETTNAQAPGEPETKVWPVGLAERLRRWTTS